MTELLENVELADKNTFRLPAKARYYAEFATPEDLKDLLGRPEVMGLPVLSASEVPEAFSKIRFSLACTEGAF